MIDQGTFYLELLRELGTPEKPFQILKPGPSGHYEISAAGYTYFAINFDIETLMRACVFIQSGIRKDQGW